MFIWQGNWEIWVEKMVLILLFIYLILLFCYRSKIQGLGLYAARDLEKHTMVIEYIGEIIRTELAETREKKYEAKVSRNCCYFLKHLMFVGTNVAHTIF